VGYNLCTTPSCIIVYFDNNVSHKIFESDIKEKVYLKHIDDKTVKICYCFHYTLGDIMNDACKNGLGEVYKKIVEGTKAGICACDIKNPEGKCSLPLIKKIIDNVL
jgi:hypothetical protein